MLRRAVATALEAGLDPVIVVLGHESDRARAELAGSSCTTLVNPEYIGLLVTNHIGWFMLGGAAGLMTLGIVWMRKIVNIDV